MKRQMKNLCILLIYILVMIIPLKVNATSIILHNSSLTIGPQYTEVLGYTLSDNLNSDDIIWTSSDSEIIKVDNGVITAIAEQGTATITATINGVSSTCKVTINSNYIPIKDIKLSTSNINVLINTTEKIIATLSPSNATNKGVTWISSDSNVATINKDGIITAKNIGTTIITATTSNGKKTTCRVTVVDTIALKTIEFDEPNITIKEKDSAILNINFIPSNATNKKVTWKSSNPNIVTIDSSGKITAIKPGTATITVVSNEGGFVATCRITVEEISKTVTNISINKEELNLVAGKSEQLNITIEPDYAENKNIIWKSLDENIAKVEDGLVTGLSSGVVEIKAVSEDSNQEAICKVTVTTPPLKSINFEETEYTLYIGDNFQLNYIKEPIYASLINPVWTSSNKSVATVIDGNITAFSIGETTITLSTKDNEIKASTKVIVVEKPKEKLQINIEGYDLNFDESKQQYELTIKNEESLVINTNIDEDKVRINGNRHLKNGSIITINILDVENKTYIINIKQTNYTMYFVLIIVILLIINVLRIIITKSRNKTKSKLNKSEVVR